MAFLLSRTNVPIVSVGMVSDDAFTAGDTSAWAAIFRTAYRSARGQGVPLQGQIRISTNMVERVIGSPVVIEAPLQSLLTLSQEFDGLALFVDTSLSDDTAILG